MGHTHSHSHHHPDGHRHPDAAPQHGEPADLPAALDLSVPDSELSPADVSRRGFLRGAGLLGAAAAGTGVLGGLAGAVGSGSPATAGSGNGGGDELRWLAGDHHIHTQYSGDAKYRVVDQVRHAGAYGLDWMVITDHGGANHARIGVEKVNPDIVAAREEVPELLVFQGLEWNIPAAEHGTVFVHPGRNEVAVLKEFENGYDGSVTNTSSPSAANEAVAIAGLNFLADAVARRRVTDALMLANHPARKGLDSPHEIRAWRDAQPRIAVGMEGAPGHQAGGMPAPGGRAGGRGLYDSSPSASSFAAYPLESYRTWGGFDWMTATVGGLWDSLLAEGRPWWITANSDSHQVWLDTAVRPADTDFDTNGYHSDPVHSAVPATGESDFWPGYYSRTHVGATADTYRAVMDGIRAGRIWVDHGGLIRGLDARLRVAGDRRRDSGVTLGGVLTVRRGTTVELTIRISLATTPNWAQFVPRLARVDVIAGDVTGPATDRDTFTAPASRVVKSFEVGTGASEVTFTYSLGRVERPCYVRLRGTDGNRSATGLLGAGVDPTGPAMDLIGNADPWADLWFYANPMWILPG